MPFFFKAIWIFSLILGSFFCLSSELLSKEPVRLLPQSRGEVVLSFSPVVDKTTSAVANVYATRMAPVRLYGGFGNNPFFRYFFDRQGFGIPIERVQASLGSGVFVTSDGTFVTNGHVIADAVEIKIALADRREFDAKVIARDERTDLAVLHVSQPGVSFPFLRWGDSDNLRVGDIVLAIGNPFGVGQTVTSGIVSALARSGVGVTDYQSFIQTDASINPGNSGGPLVNLKGELVGINTTIVSRSGGSQGLGFAIPSNMVRLVVESVAHDGIVRRPWLGARLQTVTNDIAKALNLDKPFGVLVLSVLKDSPAARSGLKEGDLIIEIDHHQVLDVDNFGYHFSTRGVEGVTKLQIMRGGHKTVLSLSLESAPEIPPRDETFLQGSHPLAGAKVVNLSPAVAEELRLEMNEQGVIVMEVVSGSLALSIGLARGDIILQVNGKKVPDVKMLVSLLSKRSHRWSLIINRAGQKLTLVLSG
ncbi:MAG: Do family serine endopeptidase [Alphaproteobacteria bacterium]|nr:Do family serine endopeptidase [Alphaproteobacteria bacterium]